MSQLTAEQLQEVSALIAEKTAGLTTLTKDQRVEIDSLLEGKLKATSLSPGQKWEAGVIVATILGGAIAIFGTAGLFFVKSAAEGVAKVTVVETRQNEVAGILRADTAFVRSVAGLISAIPPNGVVAFDSPQGCPAGWSEYANARGRTIVGVGQGTGLSARAYQALGGSEELKLTLDQLPPHNFTANARAAQANTAGDRYNAGGRDYPAIVQSPTIIETNSVGKGDPIDKMPPYVVLYYCKKGS